MLTCIAIDDEPLALELLEDNISKVPFLKLTAAFSNPLKALELLQRQTVDLVFLDIQMPGITGLQFIQSLPQKPMFILITAYEKFALEGFNLSVVDYLVKPVSLDRFILACNKANELHQLRQQQNTHSSVNYFFINADYSMVKIFYSDVLYIEGLKDYIKIHLHSTAKPIVPRLTMKGIEEQLPPQLFMRVHKSYIVSKEHISAVRKNSLFIGKTEIPVGDMYRDAVTAYTGKQVE